MLLTDKIISVYTTALYLTITCTWIIPILL